jgi:probable phosphoglycerate mutase
VSGTATTFLLIRHGETAWNAAARIQGHIDIPLSDRGRRQARALADFLRAEQVAAVYASDLARARETAAPVAEAHALALRLDARLRERGFGLFEGHTYQEAEARWPTEYAVWKRREPAYALPGGESYLQARLRVLQCLGEIAAAHGGGTVAVVTHGGVLDIVFRAAHAIPWETPRNHLLPNASINRVEVRLPGPEFSVLAWAQGGHLDELTD